MFSVARRSFISGVRRASTQSTGAKSGSSPLVWVGALAATGGIFGYYYMTTTGSTSTSSAKPVKIAMVDPKEWIDFKVVDIEKLSSNTKKFTFALPGDEYVLGMHAASAILTKFTPSGSEKPVIRPYTPISPDEQRGSFELLVKHYPNGPMSTHFSELDVGQSISFKGPISKYPWAPNKHDHIVLIAGGTGITPMYQLVQSILRNSQNDKTKITLLYGNVTEDDILLRRELESYQQKYPDQFKVLYALDKPPKGWNGISGFITKSVLASNIPKPEPQANIKIFVCGPPPMYKSLSGPKVSPSDQGEVSGILKELGYTKEHVYKF